MVISPYGIAYLLAPWLFNIYKCLQTWPSYCPYFIEITTILFYYHFAETILQILVPTFCQKYFISDLD